MGHVSAVLSTVFLCQILATELGDETFIIAAIMSMQHPRLVVYAGAMTALIFMTVSSPPCTAVCSYLHPYLFHLLSFSVQKCNLAILSSSIIHFQIMT